MRGQSPHCVKGHGVSGYRLVGISPSILPLNRQLNLLIPSGDAHFINEPIDGSGGNAGNVFRPFRGVVFQPIQE